MSSKELLAKQFASRSLLDYAALTNLASVVGSFSNMEEFQNFYGMCVGTEDPLNVPFINRNLLATRAIWQSNYDRLLKVQS